MSYYDDYEMPTTLIRKKKRHSKLTHSEPKASIDDILDTLDLDLHDDSPDYYDPLELFPVKKEKKKKKFAGLQLSYDWRTKSLGIGFMYKED